MQLVDDIASDARVAIRSADDLAQLEAARQKILGKKGTLTLALKNLRELDESARRSAGAELNKLKAELEESFRSREQELSSRELAATLEKQWLDVTLPVEGRPAVSSRGSLHPLTRVQRELETVFQTLGFTVVDGPEVETDYCNFEALNVPSTHPARDMQDTFWTKKGDLLRTHTSSIQVRALQSMKPPLRIVAPGRVYRYERIDASHEHTFYQMEGMMVDRHVTVGHVIYFMRTLLREIFGFEAKIRLRPGYFPFVEPGFELDIWFKNRWLELLPCGLIHPRVLEFGGIDPNEWQGFAFGLGLSRLVMSRYKIDDIRHLQAGDLRFLEQFA